MKACPSCSRLYPLDAGFCPVDGSSLVNASIVPAANDPDDRRVGSLLLERYQVRRVVADGGMGRVYEALDLKEGRNVAIKVLHHEVADDPIQVERFRREYAVSHQLPHDYIVEVFEFSQLPGGGYALVMEFLFGEELSQALEREQFMSPARLVRMMSQIAMGLDPAHQHKLVHRDLKPDNIFLCQTPEGDNIKLLDFGSVKDKGFGATKLTMMGTTIGSPSYMAPEQVQGLESLDHRADIWALGAVAYQFISGNLPFSGSNGAEILLSILSREAPPLGAVAAPRFAIPKKMDRVLGKAFKKTASLRYESVGAFANAIGWAYGLEGDHCQWAKAPEVELSERIELRASGPRRIPSFPARPNAQDDFFGDSDSLAEELPAQPPHARTRPERPRPSDSPESLLPELPQTRLPLWAKLFFLLVLAGIGVGIVLLR